MVIKKLTGIDKKFYLALERILVPALANVTPVKTGFAAGDWKIVPMGNLRFKLQNDAGYVIYTEEGTRPHIIRAKTGKWLKFKKPKTPKTRAGQKIPGNRAFEKDGYIYAKAVNHPGIKGRHYIKKVLENQEMWDKILEDVMSQS